MKLDDLTINVKMEGFGEAKDKLSNIESQIDRILNKQKQLYNLSCNHQTIDLGKVTTDGIDIEQLAEELNSYMKQFRYY